MQGIVPLHNNFITNNVPMTETPSVEIEFKESENKKKMYLTRLLLLSCFLYVHGGKI